MTSIRDTNLYDLLVKPQAGVILGVYPSSDPQFDIELERAEGSSTGTFDFIARLSPPAGGGVFQYRDILPLNDVVRVYRARSVRDGYTASSYTATASARPDILPGEDIPTPHLSGAGISADVWLSSGATVKVGDFATPSAVGKAFRVPWGEFLPQNDTTPWVAADYLTPGSTGGIERYRAPMVMPKGVTITGFRSRLYLETTDDRATIRLRRVSDDGSGTNLATLDATATGWNTLAVTTLSQEVGDESYVAQLELTANSTVFGARLLWAEPIYDMPDYSKGL